MKNKENILAISNVALDYKRIKLRAGQKLLTGDQLYHNRPDIMLVTEQKVVVIEVAVSHIQNLRLQEKIKRVRYEVNSAEHITETNYNKVSRGENLCKSLNRMYNRPVDLYVVVFGCFGEVIETEEL